MDRIDSIIAAVVGIGILAAFTVGLAESINAAPFWVIVGIVLVLAFRDFYDDCIKKNRNGE
ncbi:MAG: hypothetical protein AAF530_06230 [Pseudomonadota bacterium]